MQLVTIADLDRPDNETAPLITQAQRLAEIWMEFLKQDGDKHEYTTTDFGEKSRSPGIHGSEMSTCMLRTVYSVMGVERRVSAASADANMKLRFRTGTAIHRQLQTDFHRMSEWYTERMRNSGYMLTFEDELPINKNLQELAAKWDLSSSCDGAFTFWRWDGQRWLPYLRVGVEIKTSSDKQFEGRKKPEPEHMEQTCMYQACLDLPLMWIIYYNKSNSNFTTPYFPWLFKFDRNKWERDLEVRFAKVHGHAQSGQMPERSEGGHCRWCPFSWLCQPKSLQRQQAYVATPVVNAGMLVRR